MCWLEQYHDTATSGTVRCLLVNTLKIHDTVDFAKDSVTEDPQLAAERFETMARQWERVDEDTAVGPRFGMEFPQLSQRQYRRTLADNGNAIFDSGKRRHRCRRTGRGDGFLRQLKCERQTAAEVVMDDALVQDDGIDSIVEEVDRCLEVTQDLDKASKIEKASSRHRGTSKCKRLSCHTWQGGSFTFYNCEMHW